MNTKSKQLLIHLSLITGVGPASVLKIIKRFSDLFNSSQKNPQIQNLNLNLFNLYDYSVSNFVKEFGIQSNIAQILFDGLRDKTRLEKELELIEKYKIDLLTFLDSEYPENLKEIHNPPIVLYCKGAKLNSFKKNIAIVGARKADGYAQAVINELVPGLVKNDYTIVSGGAIGADSMAHQATLNANGATVAVLGSGLLHPYPKCNKELFRNIIKNGGTLVSPFPLLCVPEKGNFPARNRVIAGLSDGCLVVQAAQKSGALITAYFALEEGRQVFAIPGSIHDELSLGCNDLIKQGAKLVNSVNDILEEFGEQNCCVLQDEKLEQQEVVQKEIIKKEPEKEKSCEQDPILKFLKFHCSMDELTTKTGFNLQELQDKLFDLQLEGKVKQNFNGMWEKA